MGKIQFYIKCNASQIQPIPQIEQHNYPNIKEYKY